MTLVEELEAERENISKMVADLQAVDPLDYEGMNAIQAEYNKLTLKAQLLQKQHELTVTIDGIISYESAQTSTERV